MTYIDLIANWKLGQDKTKLNSHRISRLDKTAKRWTCSVSKFSVADSLDFLWVHFTPQTRTRQDCLVLSCSILNLIDVTRECDKHKDRRSDSLVANAALNYVVHPKPNIWMGFVINHIMLLVLTSQNSLRTYTFTRKVFTVVDNTS